MLQKMGRKFCLSTHRKNEERNDHCKYHTATRAACGLMTTAKEFEPPNLQWYCSLESMSVLVHICIYPLWHVTFATGILNDLPGLTSCGCDNIGLVSLILLCCTMYWELHVLYHCTMCTRHTDLVSLSG